MKRVIPAVKRRAVLLVLYEALKQFERGELDTADIGVGILPVNLSAVYRQVEKALEEPL